MMMSDRELLELAAKAAGIEFSWINNDGARLDRKPGIMQPYVRWNPLTDDGDALRLAVTLGMAIYCPHSLSAFAGAGELLERIGDDPYAATRRAIVRAAAAMAPKETA
jgi:hypothetical protein